MSGSRRNSMDNSPHSLSNEVSGLLREQDSSWTGVPEYHPFTRLPMLDRMQRIHRALGAVTGSDNYLGSSEALGTSIEFVNQAFDRYEGLSESPEYNWVFAVPGRGEEHQGNDEYASEVTPFLPILDPRFGVDAGIRQHVVADLAPSVIETYKGRNFGTETGAVVWAPVFIDANARIDKDRWRNFVSSNKQSINDTSEFVRQRLRASVMGLGAILPSFTQLGKTIQQEGLVTTTGHGGTVYLLTEAVHEVVERVGGDTKTIGMLGLGSIGGSTAEVLLESGEDFTLNLYDVDAEQMLKITKKPGRESRVWPAFSEVELLESSDIIVAAVSRTFDLDLMEWERGQKIDLSGKVIIDDSQPGCFSREQVEARGGKLVWVVGQDESKTKTLHRSGGYNFGEAAGLYGEGAVWGCEAEVAAIFLQNRPDLAVRTLVTPDIALSVGALCRAIDIRIARPLQSFGYPVDLNTGSGFALASGGL